MIGPWSYEVDFELQQLDMEFEVMKGKYDELRHRYQNAGRDEELKKDLIQ